MVVKHSRVVLLMNLQTLLTGETLATSVTHIRLNRHVLRVLVVDDLTENVNYDYVKSFSDYSEAACVLCEPHKFITETIT